MPGNNLTDATYELIERMEKKANKINIIIMKYFFITAFGLSVNIIAYLTYANQKGMMPDMSLVLMSMFAALLILPTIIGTKRYVELRKAKSQLQQFESLESTVYEEVLKGKDII
jgi:Na+/H+-dicarboxylate symporter